jgi:uncharacterized membrane protein YoaK (UPF0700 family)
MLLMIADSLIIAAAILNSSVRSVGSASVPNKNVCFNLTATTQEIFHAFKTQQDDTK